jgi:hypothetical protein
MLLDRSMYKKVIFWLTFFTVILVLTMLDPTQAKGGKTKNSQHGRGETLRGLLDRIQKEDVPLVVGKKQRVKEATKHRNRIKAIGKTIRGVNHSMKHKK